MYSETRDKQINYYLKLSGVVLILFVAFFTMVVSGALSRYLQTNSSEKTITVSGYSEMKVVPDMRTLYISIEGKGKTEKLAQDAASLNSKTGSDSLDALKISKADIKSQSLSTYPEYKNESNCIAPLYPSRGGTEIYPPCAQNSVIVGYITSQSIEVTLRGETMNKAADIVADLTNKGITVQTGSATVENPEKLKVELRANAIMDARKNAEKLAEALGVHLGKVQSFNEDIGGYNPWMSKMETRAMGAGADSVTPPVISDGTEKLTSTVSVSFAIR